MVQWGVRLTSAELTTDIGLRLDDTENIRWTLVQKQAAVKAAIRMARGQWWEERIDATNTYTRRVYRYDMPPACESVEQLFFEAPSSANRKEVSPSSWHVEGTEIVFEESFGQYTGRTLYIVYLVYPFNLLTTTAADGVIAVATPTSLTSVTATFTTDGVQEGDPVEIVGDDTYYVAAVVNPTTLTLHKAATVGDPLTYYVAYHTDMPYEYLLSAAMGELYEMVSRNRPGIEVDEAIRWATYYRQLAARTLHMQGRHLRPRRRY